MPSDQYIHILDKIVYWAVKDAKQIFAPNTPGFFFSQRLLFMGKNQTQATNQSDFNYFFLKKYSCANLH